MMEDQSKEFLVELDKLMVSQVSLTQWAHNMDLFAIATFDNTVELYRISYKAQRVFQSEQIKPIKCLSFSLDSQLLAYGLLDGTIRILKTQNGQKVTSVQGIHHSEIENLTFIWYDKVEPKNFMPFQKNSIQQKLILNVSPHKNCNKYLKLQHRNAIIKINYFNELKEDFVLLLASEKRKTTIYLNGFIPITEIFYENMFHSQYKILYSYYDDKIYTIASEEKMEGFALNLIQYQCQEFSKYRKDIIKFHCLIGYISELLQFAQGTFTVAESQIKDIMRQYNSKMNLIDDPNRQNINPCEELFRFLNLGITSPALITFFSKELYDSKIPQKLDETLTSLFSNLHDLLLESTLNSLQRATILLDQLYKMGQQLKTFNFSIKKLQQVKNGIVRLYTMTQMLLLESTQAKFDIRNLLVWLNKSTIKTAQQNDTQIENTKSYLNKYTVDFTRLHNFLANQSRFKLQNLGIFFSKEQISRKIETHPLQFRVFNTMYTQKKPNPQQQSNFKLMEKLLDVEDILISEQNITEEISYNNFKVQVGNCMKSWQSLKIEPAQHIRKSIMSNSKQYKIGQILFNEFFQFYIKPIVKQNQLFVYYVEHGDKRDNLIEYNCHTKTKNQLYTETHHIVQLAVAEIILVVLEQKKTGVKTVSQIVNENFDDSQIQIGRQISKIAGELNINCSFKGLNSVVVDKNKLIIFD